ncbi:MAG: hypothetical protein JW724_08210 [Candidatus Altiarchaeota archaeon]|nr:hypothetical protein [Candidatus Altiarchaeota archaeon]
MTVRPPPQEAGKGDDLMEECKKLILQSHTITWRHAILTGDFAALRMTSGFDVN